VRKIEVAPGVALNLRHLDGSGTPYLLVHGLASNARLWDQVAARLSAAGHPVWAVDLRAHGLSDAPDEGYDTATAADDLAAVITGLGLTRPVVVGQSWGGNVVVELTGRRPELVAAVGLVDGGWIDLPASFSDWESCARALRPPDIDGTSADQVRGRLRQGHPAWPDEAIEATLANLRELPDGTVRRPLSVERHMMIVRSMWDSPPGKWFGSISCPAMLLAAMGPYADRAPTVRAAVTAIPDARVRWYPDADHDLHAQLPDQVAADLLELA
jgi:pimeloyl-ACP methyl ester carboxylesterase